MLQWGKRNKRVMVFIERKNSAEFASRSITKLETMVSKLAEECHMATQGPM